MYKELPVQNRVIERRVADAENDRHSQAIRKIMNAPVRPPRQVSQSSTIQHGANTRKNAIAYQRHLEIEINNRKLLDNMSRIMHNDYKSAVKTAISNRKFRPNANSLIRRDNVNQRVKLIKVVFCFLQHQERSVV